MNVRRYRISKEPNRHREGEQFALRQRLHKKLAVEYGQQMQSSCRVCTTFRPIIVYQCNGRARFGRLQSHRYAWMRFRRTRSRSSSTNARISSTTRVLRAGRPKIRREPRAVKSSISCAVGCSCVSLLLLLGGEPREEAVGGFGGMDRGLKGGLRGASPVSILVSCEDYCDR